jgi:hypothetical protein
MYNSPSKSQATPNKLVLPEESGLDAVEAHLREGEEANEREDYSMSNLETNLPGRLRNTTLHYSNGLLPLFEAVANSIHSIEEAGLAPDKGQISVDILRDTQSHFDFETKKPGPDPCGNILGFKITDNGIGFNETNMKSFLTLDSEHKADKGGRGVGRLIWLKAFSNVKIKSSFNGDDSKLKSRVFTFNANAGVTDDKVDDASVGAAKFTCVHLDGFGEKYRDASYKTAKPIANSLLEHCLWYFVRQGGAPHIIIRDNDEVLNLDEIYEEHMFSSAVNESLLIKEKEFTLTHIKLRTNSSKSHHIALCAANRLVKEENLKGKVPGLYGSLHDERGDFIYTCYVSSTFLDENVRSERTGFDIAEQPHEVFAQTEISLDDIRNGVIAKATEHLSEYLTENKNKGKERVNNFVSQKAPRYRPILNRIPDDKLYVDPDMSDKELELALHKHLSDIEGKLLADGHNVMSPKPDEDYADYRKRLQEYLKTAEDIKKSDLANYVSHRRVIIDLLEKAIEKGDDGKYAREDLIHNLIMPMRNDSTEVMLDSCNLWLLDERLAFHDYLASDKTLCSMPITGSGEKKEPDICALNVWDNPLLVSEGNRLPLASIIVVEIKRPMRNDAAEGEEKDPIEQALFYLDRIRQGKVQTAAGRPIPVSSDIPGFCYILADITPTLEARCKMHAAVRTSDGLGYFVYKDSFKAYVEVISFNRLVNAAKERNRAFFEKLGLPT